ncbi:MAG: glycosyltransferase family 2 protein [Coraliomargaritaceae bacterium]
MLKIPATCYIRTLNEEKRIRPVVQAALELVAEVVVIDSGSTDNTISIARNEGAQVIKNEWLGNGHQKRLGEEAAHYDWLLDLDADEILSEELCEEIRGLFTSSEPPPGIYSLRLVTVPPYPKGIIWHHSNVFHRNKLYHKKVAQMPAHAAWDQLKIPAGQKVEKLRGPLLHYSFADIEQQMSKMNRVSSVRANETKLKPKWLLALRILFAFPFYLFKKLVLQRMYRAGIYGFACAVVIASNRWLKDVKMYEIHLAKNGRNKL